ncbi:hypothetical protein EV121DRAFT_282462 [Schizophyllum commune]
MAHLKDFTLFVATREQIIEHRTRTFPVWGGGHTVDEYLARDAACEQQENSIEGRLITWVLAPRDDPKTLDFPCAVESYRRDGRFYDGELQRVTAYNVACVYTKEDKRRKGYANHMMRLLHWVLADEHFLDLKAFPSEWGAPPTRLPEAGGAYFSALWSGIGPDFYKTCGEAPGRDGWLIKDSRSTIWKLEEAKESAKEPTSGWQWLDQKEVKAAWDADVPLMERDIEKLGKQLGKPVVSFLPNKGVAAFQHERCIFSAPHEPFLFKSWGVRATEGDLAYATWTVDVKRKSLGLKNLLLTRLRAKDDAQFKELVSAVLWYAKENGCQAVEMWNLPRKFEAAAKELAGETFVRDSFLPALKTYAIEDAEYAFNERFHWC